MSSYAYCINNPLSYLDPMGLKEAKYFVDGIYMWNGFRWERIDDPVVSEAVAATRDIIVPSVDLSYEYLPSAFAAGLSQAEFRFSSHPAWETPFYPWGGAYYTGRAAEEFVGGLGEEILEIARADVTGLPRYEERIFSPEQLQRGYGTLQSLRRYRANVQRWWMLAKISKSAALAAFDKVYRMYLNENPPEYNFWWDIIPSNAACQLEAGSLLGYFDAFGLLMNDYFKPQVERRWFWHTYIGLYDMKTGERVRIYDPSFWRILSWVPGYR